MTTTDRNLSGSRWDARTADGWHVLDHHDGVTLWAKADQREAERDETGEVLQAWTARTPAKQMHPTDASPMSHCAHGVRLTRRCFDCARENG